MSNAPIIEAHALSKTYHEDKLAIPVLDKINCAFYSGDLAVILGPSGSGKSTLLHCLGGLEKTSEGEVFWQGKSLATLSEKARCQLRGQSLGFVYQFHHLLPEFTALENVMLPALISGSSRLEAKEKAAHYLEAVGLSKRLTHKPSALSGGERQRTAIARALVNDPICVLADEPTGNLDSAAALSFYELLLSINQMYQTAFIVVTHDQNALRFLDKVYEMQSGRLLLKEAM